MDKIIRMYNRKQALQLCLNNLVYLHDVINLTDTELLELISKVDDDIEECIEKKKREGTLF